MKGAAALCTWVKDSSKYPTPFNAGNGVTEDPFKWFEKDRYRGARFHVTMTGAAKAFPDSIFLDGKSLA